MANSIGQVEGLPTTEVPERANRRRFSAAYKLDIVRRADACQRPGELGALLRSEGLYTSHLSAWRNQRGKVSEAGLSGVKRGRPKADARDVKIAQLTKEVARYKARAERAEAAVELQKKVSQILGFALASDEDRS